MSHQRRITLKRKEEKEEKEEHDDINEYLERHKKKVKQQIETLKRKQGVELLNLIANEYGIKIKILEEKKEEEEVEEEINVNTNRKIIKTSSGIKIIKKE